MMPSSVTGLLRAVAIFLLLLVVASVADAQPRRDRVDNRGRSFRLAFLHTNGFDEFPRLAVVVAAERPTSGRITYVATGRSVNINVPGNTARRFDLDTFALLLPDPRFTPISNNTLLLEFDQEVVVYGVNTQRWSTDNFLALPADVTGTEHVILSYPNTLSPDPTSAFVGGSDFPSQFAVIATEDGTTLTIEPTVRFTSQGNPGNVTISLDEGQAYFAQAAGRIGQDVTGTRVTANKPIIVYGSHQRTNIPFDDAVGRDHLVEQLPPVDRWGTRYFVTPHYQLPKTLADANIIRVIAAEDSTVIRIDSTYYTTIGARRVIELPLDAAHELTANRPILVAQYQHSTADEKYMRSEVDSIGDPFMMLAIPPALFDTVYWFESLDTKDFRYHYVNVVIPTERISTLRLDGGGVNAQFSRIGNTSYSFAQIALTPGIHSMRAAVPFGLYSYGYGPYNSYGYPGAIVFDTLYKDQKPPDIVWRDTCDGIVGAVVDDSTYDYGVESLRLDVGSVNVALELGAFKPGDDSLPFHVRLVDPFRDGLARLIAVDSAGLERRYDVRVKGFTVALFEEQTERELLDTLSSLNGLEFCTTLTLRNYGDYPQYVDRLRFSSTPQGLRVSGGFPATLQPGESREIEVCYLHEGDTALSIDIDVDNGCLLRPLARLPLFSGVDSLVPLIFGDFNQCDGDRVITITDNGSGNAGIRNVNILRRTNAEITLPNDFPARESQVLVRRVDPYKDMIYSFTVTDRVGNTTTVTDTVGGFTLAVRRMDRVQVGVRVDQTWERAELQFGGEHCDSLVLENYGIRTLTLQRPRMLGNVEYSIPPRQLPIILKPGERRNILVCLRPRSIGERLDTLAIDFSCGNPIELVPMKTLVLPADGDGRDRCGNLVSVEAGAFVKRSFLQAPSPNPVRGGEAEIRFGLDAPQDVSLVLFDQFGNAVRTLFENDPLPGGIVQIDAQVEDLPMGAYYVRLMTSGGMMATEKMIIAR